MLIFLYWLVLLENEDNRMKILGIDIGTTTISAVVLDMRMQNVEKAYTINNSSFLTSDYIWEKIQDPAVIIAKAKKLVDMILEEYPDIVKIGLTGQMHGIVYIDDNGKVISPLYTWQDSRCNEKCFNGESIGQIIEKKTGRNVPTGYGLATHIFNLRKGIVPQNAVQICTIMDYFGMILTGEKKPLMHSSNAASFGFYETKDNAFSKEDLETMEVDTSILPRVTEYFTILGDYRGRMVTVAIGDNQASFLGAVQDTKNAILVNMGTGGQISVLSDQCFIAENIEARPFMKGRFLLAGSSLCGGRAYATLAQFFETYAKAMGDVKTDHYAIMEKLLEKRSEEEYLKVDTRFSGTRAEPEKRGKIEEISTDNFTPAALIYGVLDGMAEELYSMYRTITAQTGDKKEKMIASGNGIRKNVWLQQIMSLKFQMPIQLAECEEEAAVGAAKSTTTV